MAIEIGTIFNFDADVSGKNIDYTGRKIIIIFDYRSFPNNSLSLLVIAPLGAEYL